MITGFSMRYDPKTVTGEQFVYSLLIAAVSITVSILISICVEKIKGRKSAKTSVKESKHISNNQTEQKRTHDK